MNFQDICVAIVACVCLSAIAHTVNFDPFDYWQETWSRYKPAVQETLTDDSIPYESD